MAQPDLPEVIATLRAKEERRKRLTPFQSAFAAARKKHGGAGGVFEFGGRKFTTEWREEKAARKKKGLTYAQAYGKKGADSPPTPPAPPVVPAPVPAPETKPVAATPDSGSPGTNPPETKTSKWPYIGAAVVGTALTAAAAIPKVRRPALGALRALATKRPDLFGRFRRPDLVRARTAGRSGRGVPDPAPVPSRTRGGMHQPEGMDAPSVPSPPRPSVSVEGSMHQPFDAPVARKSSGRPRKSGSRKSGSRKSGRTKKAPAPAPAPAAPAAPKTPPPPKKSGGRKKTEMVNPDYPPKKSGGRRKKSPSKPVEESGPSVEQQIREADQELAAAGVSSPKLTKHQARQRARESKPMTASEKAASKAKTEEFMKKHPVKIYDSEGNQIGIRMPDGERVRLPKKKAPATEAKPDKPVSVTRRRGKTVRRSGGKSEAQSLGEEWAKASGAKSKSLAAKIAKLDEAGQKEAIEAAKKYAESLGKK